MNTLIIRHIADSDPAQFHVARGEGKGAGPFTVPSPVGFPVEGRPQSGLMRELRWYLEDFLQYPFPPETERAERVLASLRSWGEQAFEALFDSRKAARLFAKATEEGYEQLDLHVRSDDAGALAWPWEALRDQQGVFIAQVCQIERSLDTIRDPVTVSDALPTDRLNILLVTARPFERDIAFRSISRPLVELIEKSDLPAHVHVLRPPTFARLREHLRERPHFYHILHFDGHGAFGTPSGHDNVQRQHRGQGHLVFEDEDGRPDPVSAEQLSVLLQEHAVVATVLNACQSAMLDEGAEDPFASVAVSLLRSGCRSVVAMAYSVYVSGAQEMLPAFYGRLLETGSLAEATRAGRQKMVEQPRRVCARGRVPLEDWLVPVLYQQEPLDLSFVAGAKRPEGEKDTTLPEEASEEQNPYGFVGRDGELLKLERALRLDVPAILVQGLGGVGKTTLARGFVRWLAATEGLGLGCFWFAFQEIRSAEYVINRMGEALFGGQFGAGTLEQKIDVLAAALKQHRFLVVWDNFEVAAGIEGTPVKASLSAEDRGHLHALVRKLWGGATKVLITSRSDEAWVGTDRRKLSIGGLAGEERWEYCERILKNLGIAVDRSDKDLVELMDLLEGHPLAMRVILPKLEGRRAAEVIAALKANVAALGLEADDPHRRLAATLRFAEESIEESLRPLRIPLALHERYVDANFLEAMAKQVDAAWTRQRIDRFVGALAAAGLLRFVRGPIYEMHPALTGFLRSTCLPAPGDAARDAWSRAFVDVMGSLADALAPRPLHEQRGGFAVHGANFHTALAEAERLEMLTNQGALLQALAFHAQNARDYNEARDLFARLASLGKGHGRQGGQAAAYHQLGRIAQEQRHFDDAEQWYGKSLAIKRKLGNEPGAAITYHQLGRLAEEQRDFDAAERWYRKALEMRERLGIEDFAAGDYHQLGMVAEERRDFDAAEQWYRKSLDIEEKLANEAGAATTYHQLGRIAQEQRDFDAAEKWYRKSLAIKEKLGDEPGAAATYHQLGMIAQEQRDFDAAEQWYRKSLAVFEKLGIVGHAGTTYHQLGRILEDQRDFAAAEQWYRKAVAVFEKLGMEQHAAVTYHQMGVIAQEQRHLDDAENWYRRSLAVKEKLGDDHGAASTYGQLGVLALVRERFEESGHWLIKAALSFMRTNDPVRARTVTENFLLAYRSAPALAKEHFRALWDGAGLGDFPKVDDLSHEA